MIEDVEEVSQRFVVMRRALKDQLRARRIERAQTACEAEEVDRHLSGRFRLLACGNVFRACDLSNIAGRKIQFHFGAEMNDLLRWICALSRWNEAFTILRVNDLEE